MIVESPKRKARVKRARLREERKWREMCGPVTVRFIEPALMPFSFVEPAEIESVRKSRENTPEV